MNATFFRALSISLVHKKWPLQVVFIVAIVSAGVLSCKISRATETENQILRFLPVSAKVSVDGKFDDWDLSAGIFACGDVELLRDQFGMWFHAMYDANNVYFLARWIDPTPLNHEQSSKGGHGFSGDCCQVRFITNYKTNQEAITWLTCWRDRDGISIVDRSTPGARDSRRDGVRLPNYTNALDDGAQQAFQANEDGKGYVQEFSIPWKMLTADGTCPTPGSEVRVAVEPNFTAGTFGRITIKDLFREGIAVDRVFTFRAYDHWGTGILEKAKTVAPAPVRLADSREFPVRLEKGVPVVDWKGLIQARELPGFKKITVNVPVDGYVSLNLCDKEGVVVRQLLTERSLTRGTHTFRWDGLATPTFRTPGEPLPVGDYQWDAIVHPGAKITLRGWAASSGQIPWFNGRVSGWGGDHGTPNGCATEGDQVYLGWSGAEAGRSVVGCDLDGQVRWRIGTGIGMSSEHLSVDRGIVYSLGWWDGVPCRQICRMRVKDGVFDGWKDRPSAALEIPALWEGHADAARLPQRANGMDVKEGILYLSFSEARFNPSDVTDWKALGEKLLSGGELHDRILSTLNDGQRKRLSNYVAGKLKPEQLVQGSKSDRVDVPVVAGLNALLEATDLAPLATDASVSQRAHANRRYLEEKFAPHLRSLRSNFIAVCDGSSGKLQQLVDVPAPTAIRVVNESLAYVISNGNDVLSLNLKTGKTQTIVAGLKEPKSLAVSRDGRVFVGVGAPDHQVKIFTAEGQLVGAIGIQGGRPRIGKWQSEGMYAIADIAIDEKQRLWVTEASHTPKRVSVWNLADGKLINEFFGPTQYGASGAAISPLDPDIMISEGCEWRINSTTGMARCTGVLDTHVNNFAMFCTPANKKVYVVGTIQKDTATSSGKHTRIRFFKVYERLAEGDYRLRATVTPHPDATHTDFWSDANDNQKADDGETKTLPMGLEMGGTYAWSLNLNPNDFTLYATSAAEKGVFQIRSTGFTACGAPHWETGSPKELAIPWNAAISGMRPDPTNRQLLVCEANTYFRCFDLTDGRQLWKYPNPFFSVHGSHKAPPDEPGLIRGAFGIIGTAQLPNVGTVWCINTNVGEWHLLTQGGYYLSHLFQSDPMKYRFPVKAVPGADLTYAPSGGGGEDFGGSLVQGSDGRIYVQTGKTAAWNTELTGLNNVQKISGGTVTLSADDVLLAQAQYDQQMQTASGTKLAEIKFASPAMTGEPAKDFGNTPQASYQKQADAAVKTWAVWDEKALYLAWEVIDSTPWTNGAAEPSQMYLSGDTVDFQFAADQKANAKRNEAVAGDMRISIGNLRDKPTAVLYRKVSSTKKPQTFSSGVIASYEMEFVDVLAKAEITANIRRTGKSYAVEAAIPWSDLGFTPQTDAKYRGDFGVTHGDPSGQRTRLRTYWNNQETGLVDDAVFELKMVPKNWGEIVFRR